jgi:small subunit ribosomal protein S21
MNKKHDEFELTGTTVIVDGDINKALRKFKKKVEKSEVLRDLENKEFYVPPSIQRARAKAAAKKRWQRHLTNQDLSQTNY